MANVNRPRGFSTKSLLGGGLHSGQRLYAIPTSDTSNSYAIGDCVMPSEGIFAVVVKGGFIQKGDSVKIN